MANELNSFSDQKLLAILRDETIADETKTKIGAIMSVRSKREPTEEETYDYGWNILTDRQLWDMFNSKSALFKSVRVAIGNELTARNVERSQS